MLIYLATPLAFRFCKWLKAKMTHAKPSWCVFFSRAKQQYSSRTKPRAYSKCPRWGYYIGRVRSRIVKPHYVWPEERRWDYLNAIVLHLEYSREFNQILKQSMHRLWWTLSLPLEPKECSETIPPAKRVTSDTSSWRMRLTSHPLPTGISNVAELIF